MCESDIYLIKNKEKKEKGVEKNSWVEKIMDDVVFINVDNERIVFGKMFGEETELKNCKIKSIDLLNHRIIIEKI